jgi:hypothetical protein
MDQHSAVGTLGWVCSFGLADIHLVAATGAAFLTCIYMFLAIRAKIKDHKK